MPRLLRLHPPPRQQSLVRVGTGKTQNKAKNQELVEPGGKQHLPAPPALAWPRELGLGSVSTHAPGALGSTMGLLHTDSSGQSQREHPASDAGSTPGQGGGRTSLLPIPTKPQQPRLPETLGPQIWAGGRGWKEGKSLAGWTDASRTGRQITAAREAPSPQRQPVKAGTPGARAAWPSRDPAPTASPCLRLAAPPAQPARLPSPSPNPSRQQKPCRQPPFCLPKRKNKRIRSPRGHILPIHSRSTPW